MTYAARMRGWSLPWFAGSQPSPPLVNAGLDPPHMATLPLSNHYLYSSTMPLLKFDTRACPQWLAKTIQNLVVQFDQYIDQNQIKQAEMWREAALKSMLDVFKRVPVGKPLLRQKVQQAYRALTVMLYILRLSASLTE